MRALLMLALFSFVQERPRAPMPDQLEESRRHQEWVDVKRGERTIRAFVVYPEAKGKVASVLVIHENKGLTDWVRGVADQLAEAGYVAVAPDLLSGKGPDGGNTDAFESVDAATKAIYALDSNDVLADLDAVADFAAGLPAADGRLFVAGFCYGGSRTFDFATHRPGLAGAFVFYGGPPEDDAALAKIDCTVHGFYGESDSRITQTVEKTRAAMKEHGKTYDPVIYDGAGHGFMRTGEDPEAPEADREAREEAWARWRSLLGAD